MKIEDGPAAVTGDNPRNYATVHYRMGRPGERMIRESEDLPENMLE